jgi:cytochrome c oxidase assembly protein subunit 15
VLTDSASGSAAAGPPLRFSRASLARATRALADSVLAPSSASLRRIALAGVVASAGIIMTGAAVRLSQSGLGCPDWPACTAHSIVAGGSSGSTLVHRWIEFGNRMLTGAILMISVIVSVAAWRFRPEGGGVRGDVRGGVRRGWPGGGRRRDLVVLAFTQPAGIVAQAVLGGVVVLTKLDPVWVSVHFLLSVGLVAAAVALHVRATEGAGPARPLARADLRLLAAALVAVVAVMLAAGTVVTGTGPLAGARSVARYQLPLAGVTQLHADIGWLLTGLTLAVVAGLRFSDAPRRAMRRGWTLLGLIVAQGSVGYTQYFTGLPAGLVWVHVAGALLIWITALRLLFALRDRGPLTQRPTGQAGPAPARVADA